MLKFAAVVPTCRGFKIPRQSRAVDWIIVHDRQEWPVEGEALNIIAPDPTLFGQRCDSIRSAGFLRALKDGYDVIATVDDDCVIHPTWAEEHLAGLSAEVHPWANTLKGPNVRGMPYRTDNVPVALSHGLWDGIPDFDAKTQKNKPFYRARNRNEWERIHPPFPQSAMNFAFRREVGIVMYQPAQGPDTCFDRFADIWGGLLAQRALTLHGWAFQNGGATVYHTRASDVQANLIKEAPGLECHEEFWPYVWAFDAKGSKLTTTYAKLAYYVGEFRPTNTAYRPYFPDLKERMLRWIDELEG